MGFPLGKFQRKLDSVVVDRTQDQQKTNTTYGFYK